MALLARLQGATAILVAADQRMPGEAGATGIAGIAVVGANGALGAAYQGDRGIGPREGWQAANHHEPNEKQSI